MNELDPYQVSVLALFPIVVFGPLAMFLLYVGFDELRGLWLRFRYRPNRFLSPRYKWEITQHSDTYGTMEVTVLDLRSGSPKTVLAVSGILYFFISIPGHETFKVSRSVAEQFYSIAEGMRDNPKEYLVINKKTMRIPRVYRWLIWLAITILVFKVFEFIPLLLDILLKRI